MRPAFSSTKSAAAFALLLLMLLALPVVVGKNLMPSREQAYATRSWGSGPYPYIQQQIFEEKGDIDIAFIGSSHILHCLDAVRLQADLSKKLGRPATVRVLGWGGAGFDALYFITKDLLAHRRVRMLVFYDDHNGQFRNEKSPFWFRFQEDAPTLNGLPMTEQAYFYFASLVGMPRNLLCLLRPNLPADLRARNFWEEHYRTINLVDNLGSTSSELGFANFDTDLTIPFYPYVPSTAASPRDAFVYSSNTWTNFQFSDEPLPAWQSHFARQFLALAHEHGCRLVMLYIPTIEETGLRKIPERAFWLEHLDDSLFLLGVPPEKMFGGLTDHEIHQLYYNPSHLNKNGQEYFTSLIEPSLLELYEADGNH